MDKKEPSIISPCCQRIYHFDCVQSMALSYGKSHLNCPNCREKNKFCEEALNQGVYIPEKDAEWENPTQESFYNFQAMGELYNSCDANPCACTKGPKFNLAGSRFEVIFFQFFFFNKAIRLTLTHFCTLENSCIGSLFCYARSDFTKWIGKTIDWLTYGILLFWISYIAFFALKKNRIHAPVGILWLSFEHEPAQKDQNSIWLVLDLRWFFSIFIFFSIRQLFSDPFLYAKKLLLM